MGCAGLILLTILAQPHGEAAQTATERPCPIISIRGARQHVSRQLAQANPTQQGQSFTKLSQTADD
jgi:hypothetical protein